MLGRPGERHRRPGSSCGGGSSARRWLTIRPARCRRGTACTCRGRRARRSSRRAATALGLGARRRRSARARDAPRREPPRRAHAGADRATTRSSSRAGDRVIADELVDRQLERVQRADEIGDERGARMVVDLARGAELLDLAAVHHGDPVAHRERLLLVVRHVDERRAELVLDPLQLELHLLAELHVERAERLVEQERRRTVDERARERDALLLAARELLRPAALEPSSVDDAEQLVRSARGARRAARPSPSARTRRCRRSSCAGRARTAGRPCSPAAGSAGRCVTSVPCEHDRPASGVSKPAIIRSVVVLPQPLGPSIEKNSPSAISSVTSSTAVWLPKRLLTPLSAIATDIGESNPVSGRSPQPGCLSLRHVPVPGTGTCPLREGPLRSAGGDEAEQAVCLAFGPERKYS